MTNMGHFDLATDSRLKFVVQRDRLSIPFRDYAGLIYLQLYTKDPLGGLDLIATQVRVNSVILENINHTRAMLPLFVVDRTFNSLPELISTISISNFSMRGGYFDESTPALWGSDTPTAAIVKVTNNMALNIEVTLEDCSISWVFTTYGLVQAYLKISAFRMKRCTIQNSGGLNAAVQYIPSGTIDKFSVEESNIYGDSRYSLDRVEFLSYAQYHQDKFKRLSLFKIQSVNNATFSNSVFSGNHFVKQAGLVDADQSTMLYLNSIEVFQMSAYQAGVVQINSFSQAFIVDSKFYEMSAIYHGVLSVNMESYMKIESSVFYDNQAIQNGVFKLAGNSDMEITDCEFARNRAEQTNSVASIFQVRNFVKINNSVFRENKAFINKEQNKNQLGRLIEFIAITAPIYITGSSFINNLANTGTPNLYLLTSTNVTIDDCKFTNDFEQTHFSPLNNGNYLQILAQSTVLITNCQFIKGYAISGGAIYIQGEAYVDIKKSIFSGNTAQKYGGAIYGDSMKSLRIYDYSEFIDNFATIFTGDAIYLTQFPYGTFELSETEFVSYIRHSNFACIQDIQTVNINSIHASHQNQTTSKTLKQAGFMLKDINNATVSNSIFQNLKGSYQNGGGALIIENTNNALSSPTIIRNCQIRGSQSESSGGGIAIVNAWSTQIENTLFINNQAPIKGGGLFFNCNATGLLDYPCTLVLTNCSFINNTAGQEGGAIKWNYYEPILKNVNFTSNRAQIYGNDIASVAKAFVPVYKQDIGSAKYSKISSPSFEAQHLPIESGGTISFYFGLIDKYGAFVKTDNVSSLSIMQENVRNLSEQFTAIIQSETQFQARNGFFLVENMVFIASPNSTQKLKFQTNAINKNYPDNQIPNTIIQQDGSHYQVLMEDLIELNLPIKACATGQQLLSSGVCKACELGTYLLTASSEPSTCETCQFEVSYCFGGDKVYPKPGFWRSSALSSNFFPCINSGACLGGLVTSNPVGECAEGYRGILCSSCINGYSLSQSDRKCLKCPPMRNNLMIILALAVLIIIVVAVIVSANLKNASHEKNTLPVFLRILMNHFQVIALVISFDFNWPQQVHQLYSSLQLDSNVQSQLFSVDCFIETSQDLLKSLKSDTENLIRPFFVRCMVLSVTPIALIVICSVFWYMKELLSQLRQSKLTVRIKTKQEEVTHLSLRNPEIPSTSNIHAVNTSSFANHTSTSLSPISSDGMIKSSPIVSEEKIITARDAENNTTGKIKMTVIVILFLIHPTLTREMFSIFNCKNVEGVYILYNDMDVVCYEGIHNTAALAIALPSIILYSLGIPLMGVWIIYKNRDQLSLPFVLRQYGFLYSGYRMGLASYWEMFIVFRKILIIIIQVFLVRAGKVIQALISLLFLCAMLVVTKWLSPYKQPNLNKLEMVSLITSTLSVYYSVYLVTYSEADNFYNKDAFDSGMFAIVLLLQISFFALWCYDFVNEFRHTIRKKFPRFYTAVFLCCRKDKFELEVSIEEYRQKVVTPFIGNMEETEKFIHQRIKLYEQGMMPKEDKEFRDQIHKLLQYSEKVQKKERFSLETQNKPIADKFLVKHSKRGEIASHRNLIEPKLCNFDDDTVYRELFQSNPPLMSRDMSQTMSFEDSIMLGGFSIAERQEQGSRVGAPRLKSSKRISEAIFVKRNTTFSPFKLATRELTKRSSIGMDKKAQSAFFVPDETVDEELESQASSFKQFEESFLQDNIEEGGLQKRMVSKKAVNIAPLHAEAPVDVLMKKGTQRRRKREIKKTRTVKLRGRTTKQDEDEKHRAMDQNEVQNAKPRDYGNDSYALDIRLISE